MMKKECPNVLLWVDRRLKKVTSLNLSLLINLHQLLLPRGKPSLKSIAGDSDLSPNPAEFKASFFCISGDCLPGHERP